MMWDYYDKRKGLIGRAIFERDLIPVKHFYIFLRRAAPQQLRADEDHLGGRTERVNGGFPTFLGKSPKPFPAEASIVVRC